MSTIIIGKQRIQITNPSKMWFPKDKYTKFDILDYYAQISPIMLPFLKNRPLTMQRYPDGITGEAFYQKDAPEYFPNWIKTKNIAKKSDGITHYAICNNKATLMYLANFGCLTFHLWLSQISNLENPDRLIFDLDPSSTDFKLVKKTAQKLRELLESLGLNPFVMTTGSRGLHVSVPLDKKLSYQKVKEFADNCAQILVHDDPKNLTLELRKAKRGKKIFIDTLRNQIGATAVCPFSIRAWPKAPVATPLDWDELADKKLSSQSYNIKNIFDRLAVIDNPWDDYKKPQSLKKAIKEIKSLKE